LYVRRRISLLVQVLRCRILLRQLQQIVFLLRLQLRASFAAYAATVMVR
jgi:hypothetical protein